MPDLTGRRAVVTGANSGLGLHTARELARHGAEVILAVRDLERGEAARLEIAEAARSGGSALVRRLDLADLASVREFAEEIIASGNALDLLVNNAGVMAIPRRLSADGYEMQFATNHLGHMALTLRLLPALVQAGSDSLAARVVTVSSGAHRMGRIAIDDLMGELRYRPWGAYGQSKLANLLFTFELQRRLDAARLPVSAYAAHPGFAATNLQSVAPRMKGSAFGARMAGLGNTLLAQPAQIGALPTLYAATVPGLPPGAYIGPNGFLEQRGYPKIVSCTDAARDESMAARLWGISEELIGLRFEDLARA